MVFNLYYIFNSIPLFCSSVQISANVALHLDCTKDTNVIGCPMFILNIKLKMVTKILKVWNKEIFGNVHEYVKETEEKLDQIQDNISICKLPIMVVKLGIPSKIVWVLKKRKSQDRNTDRKIPPNTQNYRNNKEKEP